jgi:hypothetical protein
MSDDDEPGPPKRYDIDLLISHPSWAPAAITRGMRWRPFRSHEVGTPFTTPAGTVLPIRHFDTRWRYEWRYETRGQHFAGALADAVTALEKRAGFLRRLIATGGEVDLTVQFLSDGYFGDAIPPDVLARMAQLGVRLGIEVYNIPQR